MENPDTFGPGPDDEHSPLNTLDACPGCGHYYVLYTTAPSAPEHIELDNDALDQWDEEHDYNIIRCSVCDYNSEDD